MNNTLIVGAGTSAEPKDYTFIDADVTAGTWYYKLARVDVSGGTDYSGSIEVEVDPTGMLPEPGVQLPAGFVMDRADLRDMQGMRVPQHGKLAPGVYFLRYDGQLHKVLVLE